METPKSLLEHAGGESALFKGFATKSLKGTICRQFDQPREMMGHIPLPSKYVCPPANVNRGRSEGRSDEARGGLDFVFERLITQGQWHGARGSRPRRFNFGI